MNDTPFTTIGDEPVEARIVAWVLGEASAFEAAELERLCEERPELLVFKRRMLALHGLLAEAEAAQPDEGWKLPPEKRKVLDEIFGEEKPVRLEAEKEKRIRRSGRRAFLAIAACVVFAIVVMRLLPWKQTSEAVIEVKPRVVGMSRPASSMAETSSENRSMPQLFGTEFEKIKSRGALEKVVENLDLTSRWNLDKEAAVKALKDNIKTENIRGTDLIKIKVRHPNKQDADDIAREVAHSYKSYRDEIESKNAERQLAELNKAVRDQEDKVEERRKVLATIARTKGTIYKGDDSLQAADQNGEAMKSDASEEAIKRGLDAQDYVDAKREFENDQQLLQTMKLKQIEETISRRIPSESVVVHEAPARTNAAESQELKFARMARSERSSIVAGAPAAQSASGLAGQSLAASDADVSGRTPNSSATSDPSVGSDPSAPVPAEAPVSAPEVAGADTMDQLARNDADPFAEASPEPSRLSAKKPAGQGAGYGSGSGGGGASQDSGRIAGEKSQLAERRLEGGREAPAPVAQPARSREVKEAAPQDELLSGLDKVLDSAAPEEAMKAAEPAGHAADGDQSQVAGAGKLVGGLEIVAGAKFKPHTGYTSEYLFKGADLSNPETEPLLKAIREQEDKVEERRKVLATIVRTKGIIYKGGDSFYGQNGVDEDQGAKNALETYHQLEQEKMQLESQLQSLLKYDAEQLMVYASGLNLPGNAVRELYPKYLETKRQLEAEKAKGLGNDHPSVKAKLEQTEATKRQIDESVANLQATLKAQLDLTSDRLQTVEAMKNETRAQAIRRGLDAQDYADAKREFENEQELLQQMKLKILEASLMKPAAPKIDLAKLMEEISATEDPYSTFSLNISDASFQIAQAALAKGEQPDSAGIKIEQFYNAVDYGDPAPSAGEPVAVVIEQSAHPVIPGRNLVRVALKTAAAGRSASQALRLTLLVDQSGSMVREDRRAAMEKALAGLAGLLTEKDSVSVVGFSRTPRLLADSMPGNQANKLAELVNQSASEGGTNLEEAIQLAEQMAARNQLAGAQNRIVLFTDGAANLGNADPVRLAERVKVLRQKGIAFDIAGIAADGLNDELLGELARNGNGRYYVVGKGADDNFAKQLAGAFRPAAENVKLQVHFNPERVGRYKLIGFEKDRLKTEDFRNDAVDAAELAAEEAGVAIYQVEPLPGGNGELGEVSVRFRDAASAQMVERSWTIPHDSGAPAIDRATPSMQLAVLSMLAAEKLKGGPLAEAIDFQQLADPRANVKGFYGNAGRVGEMLRMLDALK